MNIMIPKEVIDKIWLNHIYPVLCEQLLLLL